MFQLKIQVFFTELLSVLLTPWILFFSLPPCSAAIVDFFREFTLHVDGIGYVCSFAVFDFERHGTVRMDQQDDKSAPASAPAPMAPASKTTKPGQRQRQRDYKMEKSFLHFKATHPDWQPDTNGSMFLDKLSSHHPRPQMRESLYAGAGGRGLGLDERSRTYDQAWARGSHLLRKRDQHHHHLSYHPETSTRLETMPEDDDDGEGVAEEMGWNRRVQDRNEDDSDEEQEGFLRDAGMVGLLQQVMKR